MMTLDLEHALLKSDLNLFGLEVVEVQWSLEFIDLHSEECYVGLSEKIGIQLALQLMELVAIIVEVILLGDPDFEFALLVEMAFGRIEIDVTWKIELAVEIKPVLETESAMFMLKLLFISC